MIMEESERDILWSTPVQQVIIPHSPALQSLAKESREES